MRLITGASYSVYALELITGISKATPYRRCFLFGLPSNNDWDITPASGCVYQSKAVQSNTQLNK